MKRLLALAAFLLASSTAQAQYQFEYGGRTIRIDPDRGTVSIPGVYDNTGKKAKRATKGDQDSSRSKAPPQDAKAPQDTKADPAPADTAAAPAAPPLAAPPAPPPPATATAPDRSPRPPPTMHRRIPPCCRLRPRRHRLRYRRSSRLRRSLRRCPRRPSRP